MKQLLLVALLLLCANVAFGQDIIRTNDGQEIKAAIQEIGDNEVVYKLWSDREGPLFRIDKDKVVKITLQSGAEYYFSDLYKKIEDGQYVPKSVYYRGGYLYNSESKLKLSDNEIKSLLSAELYDKYRSAQTLNHIKNALLWPGVTFLALGGVSLYFAINHSDPAWPIAAATLGSTGAVLVLTSIPLAIISGSKAKSVARNYNEERGYLSVGVTSSGFGLAYNF